MPHPRHLLWVAANLYGRLFGRAWLEPFHHAMLLFVLHGLGYDNGWREDFTGESWFVRTYLKKRDIKVAIDVGANVGAYSSLLLKELSCEVYACEPAALSFKALSAIQDPRLHAFQTAIADHQGTATLFSEGGVSPTASLSETLGGGQRETVPVTTLDAFVAQQELARVDYVKIDTEGFEREVLLGAQSVLATYKPRFIQFEFNILHLKRGYTLHDITALLPGYSFYRLLPRGWIPIRPTGFADNIFMFSNVVAVRE